MFIETQDTNFYMTPATLSGSQLPSFQEIWNFLGNLYFRDSETFKIFSGILEHSWELDFRDLETFKIFSGILDPSCDLFRDSETFLRMGCV